MKVKQIVFDRKDNGPYLSDRVISICNFCDKCSTYKIEAYKTLLKIGGGRYYCNFCIRNRFSHKIEKDILCLDFKGPIGFLYYWLFNEDKVYMGQIQSLIKSHAVTGLQHPAFLYDYDNLTWYVDFRRIGRTSRKVSVESVIHNVYRIIDSLYLSHFDKTVNIDTLREKYTVAIKSFYKNRQRPEGKKVLSPSMRKCAFRQNADWDKGKEFTFKNQFLKEMLPEPAEEVMYSEDLTTPIQNLTVTVVEADDDVLRGHISVNGMTTALLQNDEGSSDFRDRKALNAAARKLAKSLGLKLFYSK